MVPTIMLLLSKLRLTTIVSLMRSLTYQVFVARTSILARRVARQKGKNMRSAVARVVAIGPQWKI